MDKRQRFILGGVGGLTPIVMFVVDGSLAKSLNLSGPLTLMALGFFLRVAILFLVGGFVVSLYPEVKQRYKVFQLGLGAPAMIAGLMAATTSGNAPSLYSAPNSTGMVLVPVVYAQASAPQTASSSAADLKHFTLPPQGAAAQFLAGLANIQPTPSNVWFVIAGTFTSLENARGFAQRINQKNSGFHADVYAPYPSDPYYTVVIGADLTQADAKALRDKAVQAGVNKDTYYKTFPNLPLPGK